VREVEVSTDGIEHECAKYALRGIGKDAGKAGNADVDVDGDVARRVGLQAWQ
jgi:hypothetical protein